MNRLLMYVKDLKTLSEFEKNLLKSFIEENKIQTLEELKSQIKTYIVDLHRKKDINENDFKLVRYMGIIFKKL